VAQHEAAFSGPVCKCFVWFFCFSHELATKMSAYNVLFATIVIALSVYYSGGSKSTLSTSSEPEEQENVKADIGVEESKSPQRMVLDALEDDDYYGILGLNDNASMEEIRSVSE
jgi:hypothetical protein